MKIFITCGNKKLIKKNYKKDLGKKIAIIDVPMIADDMFKSEALHETNSSAAYVLQEEIERQIRSFYNSKRFINLLYIVDVIDSGFVSIFKQYIESKNIFFTEYILIDFSNDIDPKIYQHFNNVI